MATRNRTLVFIQFRNEKKSFRGTSGNGFKDSNSVSMKLLGKSLSEEGPDNDLEVGSHKITTTIPPGWMSLIDDVNYDMSKIKQNMEKLSEYHKNHLLPQFESEGEESEQTIQILTEYITKLFHDAQTKIQRIGSQAVGPQEEFIKKNIQSALAQQLQALSVTFRKNQKDYLQKLRGRQQRGRVLQDEDSAEDDSKFDVGFTSEQLKIVDTSDQIISQRDKDIKQIVTSITELASIFKDLSILVVEQGTILDRIDYNIEQVSHNTDQAIVELRAASSSQKSYRKKLCMLLLCLCILIMVVVVILKGLIG